MYGPKDMMTMGTGPSAPDEDEIKSSRTGKQEA
jgi:hypothetical protein